MKNKKLFVLMLVSVATISFNSKLTAMLSLTKTIIGKKTIVIAGFTDACDQETITEASKITEKFFGSSAKKKTLCLLEKSEKKYSEQEKVFKKLENTPFKQNPQIDHVIARVAIQHEMKKENTRFRFCDWRPFGLINMITGFDTLRTFIQKPFLFKLHGFEIGNLNDIYKKLEDDQAYRDKFYSVLSQILKQTPEKFANPSSKKEFFTEMALLKKKLKLFFNAYDIFRKSEAKQKITTKIDSLEKRFKDFLDKFLKDDSSYCISLLAKAMEQKTPLRNFLHEIFWIVEFGDTISAASFLINCFTSDSKTIFVLARKNVACLLNNHLKSLAGACCEIEKGILEVINQFKTPSSELRGENLKNLYETAINKSKCEKCNGFFDKTMLCGRCLQTLYCSKKCQRADWKEHKKTCKKAEQK